MVDIIIVNWNAGHQIKTCVESLTNTCAKKIIVVDNASTDGSDQTVAQHPRVKLVQSGENLGFGKACNLGAGLADSEFLLFLNPDAAVFPETLEKALAFMKHEANSHIGICGVQLLDESGQVARSCSRFPSLKGFLARAFGLDKAMPRLGLAMAEWSHDKTQKVDQVIGAFFLVRRELFETLGGFDERFFVYFEEVDFSYRAKQLGWHTMYLADVQAFHSGGGTSNQVKARRLFYSLRSRLLYVSKHFGHGQAGLVFLSTLLIEPFSRSALAMARASWPSLRETWQGYRMLYQWLPKWISQGTTR